MTNPKNKSSHQGMRDIDEGLAGIFAALGAAVSEIHDRLTEGKEVDAQCNQAFETTSGPFAAEARVHLRMGGININLSAAPKEADQHNAEPSRSDDPAARTGDNDRVHS